MIYFFPVLSGQLSLHFLELQVLPQEPSSKVPAALSSPLHRFSVPHFCRPFVFSWSDYVLPCLAVSSFGLGWISLLFLGFPFLFSVPLLMLTVVIALFISDRSLNTVQDSNPASVTFISSLSLVFNNCECFFCPSPLFFPFYFYWAWPGIVTLYWWLIFKTCSVKSSWFLKTE